MADYPAAVYSPRTKENLPGIEYNAAKKTIGFVEDITKLDDEVIAIQTELGTLPKSTSASVKERLKGIRSLSDAVQDTLVIKTGKVGIGTATPTQLLTMESPALAVHLIKSRGSQSTGRTLFQVLREHADTAPYNVGFDVGMNLALSNDNFTIRELFSSGAFKYRMTIVKDTGHIAFSEGTVADARVEIETETDEGHQALTIDQNDEDKAFIDYQGTIAHTTQKNICSIIDSHYLVGFIKTEINGSEYWMPYYGIS